MRLQEPRASLSCSSSCIGEKRQSSDHEERNPKEIPFQVFGKQLPKTEIRMFISITVETHFRHRNEYDSEVLVVLGFFLPADHFTTNGTKSNLYVTGFEPE